MDEQQVLDKLDPAILIGTRFGLWPEDQEIVNVRTLADYFTQLTHLPRLHGPQVLPDCLAKGVQRGLFGYALGDGEKKKFDTIHFNDKDVTADRARSPSRPGCCGPPLAKALMPKPEPVAGRHDDRRLDHRHRHDWRRRRPARTTAGLAAGVAVKIVKGERRLNRVRIDMKIGAVGALERHLQRGH